MIINGYETNIEELTDMALHWTYKDMACEFGISIPYMQKILRRVNIKKTCVQPKRVKPKPEIVKPVIVKPVHKFPQSIKDEWLAIDINASNW